MSVKFFCDECDAPLTRDCVSQRLVLQRGGVRVEIIVGTNADGKLFVWNGGNVCEACVRKTCAEGGYAPAQVASAPLQVDPMMPRRAPAE